MDRSLHLLMVEDSEADAAFILRELRGGGYEMAFQRVETAADFTAALAAGRWDIITADYCLPGFGAMEALQLLRQSTLDLPFVIVSGMIGLDVAVEAMKCGAHDFVLKDSLARLVPVVEREVRDARARAERRRTAVCLGALSTLGQRLSPVSLPAEAAQVIGDITDDLFHWDAFTLELYDAERDCIHATFDVHSVAGGRPRVRLTPSGQSPGLLARRVIDSGAELRLKDAAAAGPPEPIAGGPASDAASRMSVPIQNQGRVIGILSIRTRRPNAYDQDNLTTFQTLADYCGEALERIQAREALAKSEERYRKLADASPLGILEADGRGRCTYVNARWTNISGLSFEQSRGFGWIRSIHPEDRWKVLREWRKAVAEASEWAHEPRLLTPEGGMIWVRVRVAKALSQEGRPAGFVATVEDVTGAKRAGEALRTSRGQLRALAAHLQSVREEERKRITREIHDGLGQSLTGFKMDLVWIRNRLQTPGKAVDRQPLLEKIGDMGALLDGQASLVRKLCTELRPGVLDDLGLSAALEWQAREYQQRTGIQCSLRLGPGELMLDAERSTALFRIFQEILTNAARHARATRVEAVIKTTDTWVVLEIKDNGQGISESEKTGTNSLGLLGMRERAFILGGEVTINGEPGVGTSVSVRIPLAQFHQADGEAMTGAPPPVGENRVPAKISNQNKGIIIEPAKKQTNRK